MIDRKFSPNNRLGAKINRISEQDLKNEIKSAIDRKLDAFLQPILQDIKRQLLANRYTYMKRVGEYWMVTGKITVDQSKFKDENEFETFLTEANNYMDSLKITRTDGAEFNYVLQTHV